MRNSPTYRVALASLALLLSAASPCAGQSVRATTLKQVSAALPAEFSSISSIREIADGRVLVVDSREQRVLVADFRAGTVADVGRSGNGPGEYRFPRVLIALPGDTTLLPTTGSRWLILVGARFVGTMGPDRPEVAASRGDLLAADSAAGVFTRVFGAASCAETETKVQDTVHIVRTSRRDLKRDTVARLGVAPTIRRRAVFADGTRAERCTPPVLPANDDAVAFPDGWVAIVRHTPFRVDWRDPRSGSTAPGRPIALELPRISERDRRAIIDSFPQQPNRMPEFDFARFPDRAPAFQQGALTAVPDGRLLVRRTQLASDSVGRYEIFDRRSALVAALTIAPNASIVGFGKSGVYVATANDVGILRLTRHPWP